MRQKTESGWRQTEELAPRQKEPNARDHDSAAEAATPARGAPLEPAPAKPPTEEQAAKRAALLKKLPEHLRLGVTLPGMRKLLSELPPDAVGQVNAKIPRGPSKKFLCFTLEGELKFPKNETFNGYCNQHWITKWAEEAKAGQPDGDGLAVCERLRKQGSPHVGEATHFVSWFLATPIETLLDALGNFVEQKGLREGDTYFWVCDYVIRQTDVKADLARLGECVSAVGHTVLLMEPWHTPAPLTRAYCITEVYHTQKSRAQFDVVMSSAQQAAFETALVDDFDSIKMSLSKVDVRTATCLKPDETKRILDELERDVGFVACNALVIGLLREALVAQGRVALARLPAAERGTSALINNLGQLLKDLGKPEEARPLYEEALQACRATLGDRHPSTLISISNMGQLLKDLGKPEEARPLYEEVLQGCRASLGDRHPNTLASISNMGNLLKAMGKLDEARPLYEEALQAKRETLGDRHPRTLISIGNMGQLLYAMGKLDEARPLLEEALQASRETLGDRHPHTLISINNMGLLLGQAMGKLEEARPLYEEALQARRETLGDRHPSTLQSINNMGKLLQAMGKLDEAKPLYEEALQARRETLGDRHPSTLISIYNLGSLLQAMGKLDEARPLYEEAIQGYRVTLGDRHPHTLISIDNMGSLLMGMGKLDEARPLLEEALQARRETLGDRHPRTLVSISNMGALLKGMGKPEEARPLLEKALQARRETLGDRHPDTLTSISNMGALLKGMGKPEEARPLLEEALQGRREVLGDRHPSTQNTIGLLQSLL